MTKMCTVCGFTTEDKEAKECPNCGGYSLRTVDKNKNTYDPSDRFRRF